MAKAKEYQFEVIGNFYKKSSLKRFTEKMSYLNFIDQQGNFKQADQNSLFHLEVLHNYQPVKLFFPFRIYPLHLLVTMKTNNPAIVKLYQEKITSKKELPVFSGGLHIHWLKGEKYFQENTEKPPEESN